VDKTDFNSQKPTQEQLTVNVLPRTLIIRPMEYKHPIGIPMFFSGVFGTDPDSKEAGDIWVGTFFDRNEAEAYLLASKTFGQPVAGVRLTIVKQEKQNGAGVSGSPETPSGG
jgi:hypothetical protein